MSSKAKNSQLILASVCIAAFTVAIIGCRDARISPCVTNLRNIEFVKGDWHHGEGKSTNDIPLWEDLRPYFPPQWSNKAPVCPEGGIYRINRLGEPPTCSIGGPKHSSRYYNNNP
jgi:hypothetical protein